MAKNKRIKAAFLECSEFKSLDLKSFHKIIVRDFMRIIFISNKTTNYQALKWHFSTREQNLIYIYKDGTILDWENLQYSFGLPSIKHWGASCIY